MRGVKKDEALAVFERLERGPEAESSGGGALPRDDGLLRTLCSRILEVVVRRVADADPLAAAARVQALRMAHPGETAAELVERLIKAKCGQTAAIGAATSATSIIPGVGTVLALTAGMAVDISSTLKLHTELVLEIAAARGKRLTEIERSEVILAVTGISSGFGQIGRQAARGLSGKTGELAARKWLSKALPVIGVAASAGTNVLSTYIIGRRADTYFNRGPEQMGNWKDNLRAISGVDEQKIAAWVAESTGSLGRAVSLTGQTFAAGGAKGAAAVAGGAGRAARLMGAAGVKSLGKVRQAAGIILGAGQTAASFITGSATKSPGSFSTKKKSGKPEPTFAPVGVDRECGERFIQKALACGASLAGIASVQALAASGSYARGERIKCAVKGKSLLVLALAADERWPEFDWWDSRPGATPGNRRLAEIMEQVVHWSGAEETVQSRALPYNLRKGGVLLKEAAILAGLGTIGKNNLLITPAFGPRVRLRAIFIDRELAQTGPAEANFCEPCDRPCCRACPQGAFAGGVFDRSLCSIQMRSDRLGGATATGVRGANFAGAPVKYCRACELACPVGTP